MMQSDKKKKLLRLASKAVKIGSDLAEVAVHLKSTTGPLALATVGARIINSYREATEESVGEFFIKWQKLYDFGGFNEWLFAYVASQVKMEEEEASSERRGSVMTAEIHGMPFGWIKHDTWIEGPWIPGERDQDDALTAVRRLIWGGLGKSIMMQPKLLGGNEFLPDLLHDTLPSRTGEEIYAKLKKFIDKGHHRSVLLYGESGTGKSHLMRYVAKLAGGYSLRVSAKDFESVRGVSSAIRVLRPSAILIDDFERQEKPQAILGQAEEIKAHARLLMVSVNNFRKLDSAMLRVGRFDELIEVEQLEDEIFEKLIGDASPQVKTRLKQLPVAYVDEWHRIRDVLGDEEAVSELDRLEKQRQIVLKQAEKERNGDGDSPEEDEGTCCKGEEVIAI